MGVLGALITGCGIASASLWYFSRRYLGEISLDEERHPGRACFSVLDFWGNREVTVKDGLSEDVKSETLRDWILYLQSVLNCHVCLVLQSPCNEL